jgi:hypothetical protein
LIFHNTGRKYIEFEDRIIRRRICGPKREEVAGGWRRLHNEQLHNLYASSYIITVMKSTGRRWTGHVERMGELIN